MTPTLPCLRRVPVSRFDSSRQQETRRREDHAISGKRPSRRPHGS
jgi:hypothetical protein